MKSQDKGFTLIEIILALTIMFFAVSALLTIFIYTIFLNEANSNLTIAISHAQYALENKKKVNFLALPIGTETWDSDTAFDNKGLDRLNSEVVVITVTNSGSYEKDIGVTINWRDRGIIERSIAFETLRTGQ